MYDYDYSKLILKEDYNVFMEKFDEKSIFLITRDISVKTTF
jgi:hypothetical protein